ncbi:phosphoribosylformylglycinamidine synthase II [candidate division LCP-89 bacterium B3_LCP]|uniref:Phosphoribosylformylglycinamidine synthase subunit PurL n=1 Tax=candidate division LCP-89 bacterium B3_LCP TaxID=2012998 RepID=A0A532UTZ6_UNCL8|nr:MAG: phosphoribosylformylglycinamidine synthase II [candidate division LCP-89 bacterium B3_LCP]
MTPPPVTLNLAVQHGLNEEEYDRILKILGRTPTFAELGVFSVMWSEHCSYKNSIHELKKLPRTSPRMLAEAGEENAGLVDIGHGLAVAFKIESHNHPCAVEPYQGAATGVGGIMRDIFTMGARPIASLDSLHLGPLEVPRNRFLMDGVVRGVGDYGNCLGIPTVAGEVVFHEGYSANPIINCMAVGIVKKDHIASATAEGEGNPVIMFGSRTGRDGIHGATFASEEISDESEEKRSSVQVGDPFAEKLLLEATLELVKSGVLVGIQDMGAAGITCSSSEMSAHGKSGIEIDLDKVALREEGMSAYEILLSESQERMLAVVKKGREEEAEAILNRWELLHANIGRVTSDGNMRVFFQGEQVCEIPSEMLALGGGTPVYQRESRRPEFLDETNNIDLGPYRQERDWNVALLSLLASPNICDKSWVTEQYDATVRTNTIAGPGGDAAVIWVKDTPLALAMTTDCNPRFVYLNPRRGAALAVAEAARNVSCTGAEPIAITNCLNFGNPYKPESFYYFKEAVAGMGEACRIFETPVTGGNVSFYNEAEDTSILPTPVIGMLGLLQDVDKAIGSRFKNAGDRIILLGQTGPDLGGSEYLYHIHGVLAGDAPTLDLDLEKRTQKCLREAIKRGLLRSAHDCSEGGFTVALAECCMISQHETLGAVVQLKEGDLTTTDLLFAETPSRIIISVLPEHINDVITFAESMQVPAIEIGEVTDDSLKIGGWVDLPSDAMRKAYFDSLHSMFSKAQAIE